MPEYLNGVCAVCGRKYHVCNDCKNTRAFTPWRAIADTRNCYKIYLILLDYTNGYLDAAGAAKKLRSCELSEIETFEEPVRKALGRILEA